MGGGSGDADDVDDALAASLCLSGCFGLGNGRGGRDLMRGRALHSSQSADKASKYIL